jgi:hypothetical protein
VLLVHMQGPEISGVQSWNFCGRVSEKRAEKKQRDAATREPIWGIDGMTCAMKRKRGVNCLLLAFHGVIHLLTVS